MIYLAVGFAGGIGATLRYCVSRLSIYLGWASFPLATILVNVLGSFLIGYAMLALQSKSGANDALKTVVLTGFLGGFTTFSAFSLETVSMIERGEPLKALIYVFATVLSCLLACALGLVVARSSL